MTRLNQDLFAAIGVRRRGWGWVAWRVVGRNKIMGTWLKQWLNTATCSGFVNLSFKFMIYKLLKLAFNNTQNHEIYLYNLFVTNSKIFHNVQQHHSGIISSYPIPWTPAARIFKKDPGSCLSVKQILYNKEKNIFPILANN